MTDKTAIEKLDAIKHLLIKVDSIIKPSVSTGNGFSFIDKPKKFNLPPPGIEVVRQANEPADPDDKIDRLAERAVEDDSDDDSDGSDSDADSTDDADSDSDGADEQQPIARLPLGPNNNPNNNPNDESDESDNEPVVDVAVNRNNRQRAQAQAPVHVPVIEQPQVIQADGGFTDEQFWECIRTLNWCNVSDGEIVTADVMKIINKWPAQRRVKFVETYDTMFTAGKLQMTDDIKTLGIEDDNIIDSIVSHVIGLGVDWFDNCCKGSGLLDFIVHGEHQNLHDVVNNIRQKI